MRRSAPSHFDSTDGHGRSDNDMYHHLNNSVYYYL